MSNEVIKCDQIGCSGIMEKIGGPIGGSDILSLIPGQPDRFVSFQCETLKRKIGTEIEMQKAYDDMYGIIAVKKVHAQDAPTPIEDEKKTEEEPGGHIPSGQFTKIHPHLNFPKKKVGRPRKSEIENV